jgi:uncharacterized protein (DUF433 family)
LPAERFGGPLLASLGEEAISVGRSVMAFEGSYPAARAAALSGVPVSTVYDWARTGVVVPSVSMEREKLWSYADLMALRIVSWLRHPKPEASRSPMPRVRRALQRLEEQGLDIWDAGATAGSLFVDRSGHLYIATLDGLVDDTGASLLDLGLDLLAPFASGLGTGPDLRRPRPNLRIVPGKCAGEPHLVGTRVTTLAITALADRGFDEAAIAKLYPDSDRDALREAVDLERELAGALSAA